MYVVNGIAYASGESETIEIQTAEPLQDLMMLLTSREVKNAYLMQRLFCIILCLSHWQTSLFLKQLWWKMEL